MPQKTLKERMADANRKKGCIKDCDKPVRSLSFCHSHYGKWNRTGHPLGIQRVAHGEAVSGKESREWQAWMGMRKRCRNEKHPAWKNYGGRGITVCESWYLSYDEFLKDMGRCPDNCTLDRKDNDGNYEPDNCRWAHRGIQQTNRRYVILAENDVRAIRARYDSGEPVSTIALDYPTAYHNVYNAATRKTWNWLE